MDSKRFDSMSKFVGSGANRRRVLRGLLGGGFAGAVALLADNERASAQPGCRRAGRRCEGNQECCPGLVCTQVGNNARCSPPD